MTSTNDGKDVKSNQTSGQKGKTYYIELYKSLEARLSEGGEVSERNKHLCEAWRRVHSLCQHSAPSTHTHLLSWLQRHTARAVLQAQWRLPAHKDDRESLEAAINSFIAESEAACAGRNGISTPWEEQLVARGQWFKRVLDNPWEHPVLTLLLNPNGTPPTDDEVLSWLKEERGMTFVMRLYTLCDERLYDIAISLATAVMERVRASVQTVPDADGEQNKPEADNAEPTFGDKLKTEAGFSPDVWDLFTDIEFVLLHKRDSKRCIALAKQTPLAGAYHLIERLQKRLETSPREKKLWKNAKEVAILIAQVVIARCMIVPICLGASRTALYCCVRLLAQLLPAGRLPPAADALAKQAPTARHLHTLASAVDKQLSTTTPSMKPYVCELYVRALTAGMNELERLKLKTEKEQEARTMEKTLASWFIQLGAVLSENDRIHCECTLTAFSLHPSQKMYERLEAEPQPASVATDTDETKEETKKSEFGSWANDSRSQTNFVKTSETLKMKKPRTNQTNVLSIAIFNEGEALGLSPELCQDIAVLLSGPRVKTLSWDMDRTLLLDNCRKYMESTHEGTRVLTRELKYLNLDPHLYEHLPEDRDDDENDPYYGIEKGYEHLVPPEDIWEDAYDDSDKTESAASSIEEDYFAPRRKKKNKRNPLSSDEDSNPLSFMAVEKRVQKKKERPHSKERSKERTKRMPETLVVDPLHIEGENQTQIKAKPKKERKKKESIPKAKPKKSLASLIGLKVVKKKKNPVKATTVVKSPVITDSDYDSQGKNSLHSLNSEGNDHDVHVDRFTSINELKTLERTSSDCMGLAKRGQSNILGDKTRIFSKPSHSLDRLPNSLTKMTYRPPTPNSIPRQPPSNHNRNVSPNYKNSPDRVRASLAQLLEFKRQAAVINQKQDQQTPQRKSAIIRPDMPIQNNISPKAVSIPEIPKSYINKQYTDTYAQYNKDMNEIISRGQRNELLAQRNKEIDYIIAQRNKSLSMSSLHSAIPSPVIQYAKKTAADKVFNNSSPHSVQKQTNSNKMADMVDVPYDRLMAEIAERQDSRGKFDIVRPPHTQRESAQPVPIHRSLNTVSAAQRNYQNFIKEYEQTKYTASCALDMRKAQSKNIKPVSRLEPVVPINKPESKSQCAKQSQQKKPENSLNTFSRLSYMHKNKQNEMKNKQTLDKPLFSSSTYQEVSSELDEIIKQHQRAQMKVIQAKKASLLKSEVVIQDTSNKNQSKHPLLTNMLNSSNPINNAMVCPKESQNKHKNIHETHVSATKKTLTQKDQDELLHLLRQQNKLNASNRLTTDMNSKPSTSYQSPKAMSDNILPVADYNMTSFQKQRQINKQTINTPKSIEDKIINIISNSLIKPAHSSNSEISINLNSQVTVTAKPKSTITDIKDTKTYDLQGNLNRSAAKNKVHTQNNPEKCIPESEKPGWQAVMNDLLKHKTPSRGPNALDVALNKSSFELAFERSLKEPSIFVAPKQSSNIISCGTAKNGRKVDQSKQANNNAHNIIIPSKKGVNTHTEVSKQVNNSSERKKYSNSKTQTSLHAKLMKQNHVAPKKITPEVQRKQFTYAGPKHDDPFISGIQNSDYDLLEELMDDDLRKEIGELSSDDDSYNAAAQSFLKQPKDNEKRVSVEFNKTLNDMAAKKIVYNVRCQNANPVEIAETPVIKQGNSTVKLSKSMASNNKTNDNTWKNSNEHSVSPSIPIPIKNIQNHASKSNVEKFTEKREINPNIYISAIAQQAPVQNVKNSNEHSVSPSIPIPIKNIQNHASKSNVEKITENREINPNIYISAIAQQPPVQNVVLLGSGLVYESYSTVQAPSHCVSNIIPSAYVTVNSAPNLTLYQTTAFGTPVANPLIIGSTMTVPITNNTIPIQANVNEMEPACSGAIAGRTTQVTHPTSSQYSDAYIEHGNSISETDCTSQNDKSEDVTQIIDRKVLSDMQEFVHDSTSQNQTTKDVDKICERKVLSDVREFVQDRTSQNKTSKDANKINERKVLSEVQESAQVKNLENIRQKIGSEADMEKDIAAQQERLNNKRLAIINREIYHRCGNEPIALTYAPLSVKTKTCIQQHSFPIAKPLNYEPYKEEYKTEYQKSSHCDEDKLLTQIQNNLQDLSNAIKDVPNEVIQDSTESKENKSIPTLPCRRILLRSSNKIHSKINIETNIPESLNTKISETTTTKKSKVKLKSIVSESVKQDTSSQSYTCDKEVSHTQKRVSKRLRNKTLTINSTKQPEKLTVMATETSSINKRHNSTLLEELPSKLKEVIEDNTEKPMLSAIKDCNNSSFDIENELLGSKISKTTTEKNGSNVNSSCEMMQNIDKDAKGIIPGKIIDEPSDKVTVYVVLDETKKLRNKTMGTEKHLVKDIKNSDKNIDYLTISNATMGPSMTDNDEPQSVTIPLSTVGKPMKNYRAKTTSNKTMLVGSFCQPTADNIHEVADNSHVDVATEPTNHDVPKAIRAIRNVTLTNSNEQTLVKGPIKNDRVKVSSNKTTFRRPKNKNEAAENLRVDFATQPPNPDLSEAKRNVTTSVISNEQLKDCSETIAPPPNVIKSPKIYDTRKKTGIITKEDVSVSELSENNDTLKGTGNVSQDEVLCKEPSENYDILKVTGNVSKDKVSLNEPSENGDILKVTGVVTKNDVSINENIDLDMSVTCEEVNVSKMTFAQVKTARKKKIASDIITDSHERTNECVKNDKNQSQVFEEISVNSPPKSWKIMNKDNENETKLKQTLCKVNTETSTVAISSKKSEAKVLINDDNLKNKQNAELPAPLITDSIVGTEAEKVVMVDDDSKRLSEAVEKSNVGLIPEDVKSAVQASPVIDNDQSKIPQSLKDSFSIKHLKSDNPAYKSVLVTLPDGRKCKATVYGDVNVTLDVLFSCPSIKSTLMNKLTSKKLLVNVNQITTVDTKDRSKILSAQIQDIKEMVSTVPVETIDLLSDDEDVSSPVDEPETQTFATEYGNYKISPIDNELYTKHQLRLSQKPLISLKKCDSEFKINVSSVSANIKIDESMTTAIPDKYVLGLFNDIEKKLISQSSVEPEIVEIDDSSNDSVDYGKSTDNPAVLIDELKNELLKELGVGMTKSQTGTTERILTNNLTKEEQFKIMERKCHVKLIPCDYFAKLYEEEDIEVISQHESITIREDFSILNDFDNNILESDARSSSPVIALDDVLMTLEKTPISCPEFPPQLFTLSCDADWFCTKPTIYWRTENNFKFESSNFYSQCNDKADSNIVTPKFENNCIEMLLQDNTALSLKSLVLKYIQEINIINHREYKPIYEALIMEAPAISLKRKSTLLVVPTAPKILKLNEEIDCSFSSAVSSDLFATDNTNVTMAIIENPEKTSDLELRMVDTRVKMNNTEIEEIEDAVKPLSVNNGDKENINVDEDIHKQNIASDKIDNSPLVQNVQTASEVSEGCVSSLMHKTLDVMKMISMNNTVSMNDTVKEDFNDHVNPLSITNCNNRNKNMDKDSHEQNITSDTFDKYPLVMQNFRTTSKVSEGCVSALIQKPLNTTEIISINDTSHGDVAMNIVMTEIMPQIVHEKNELREHSSSSQTLECIDASIQKISDNSLYKPVFHQNMETQDRVPKADSSASNSLDVPQISAICNNLDIYNMETEINAPEFEKTDINTSDDFLPQTPVVIGTADLVLNDNGLGIIVNDINNLRCNTALDVDVEKNEMYEEKISSKKPQIVDFSRAGISDRPNMLDIVKVEDRIENTTEIENLAKCVTLSSQIPETINESKIDRSDLHDIVVDNDKNLRTDNITTSGIINPKVSLAAEMPPIVNAAQTSSIYNNVEVNIIANHLPVQKMSKMDLGIFEDIVSSSIIPLTIDASKADDDKSRGDNFISKNMETNIKLEAHINAGVLENNLSCQTTNTIDATQATAGNDCLGLNNIRLKMLRQNIAEDGIIDKALHEDSVSPLKKEMADSSVQNLKLSLDVHIVHEDMETEILLREADIKNVEMVKQPPEITDSSPRNLDTSLDVHIVHEDMETENILHGADIQNVEIVKDSPNKLETTVASQISLDINKRQDIERDKYKIDTKNIGSQGRLLSGTSFTRDPSKTVLDQTETDNMQVELKKDGAPFLKLEMSDKSLLSRHTGLDIRVVDKDMEIESKEAFTKNVGIEDSCYKLKSANVFQVNPFDDSLDINIQDIDTDKYKGVNTNIGCLEDILTGNSRSKIILDHKTERVHILTETDTKNIDYRNEAATVKGLDTITITSKIHIVDNDNKVNIDPRIKTDFIEPVNSSEGSSIEVKCGRSHHSDKLDVSYGNEIICNHLIHNIHSQNMETGQVFKIYNRDIRIGKDIDINRQSSATADSTESTFEKNMETIHMLPELDTKNIEHTEDNVSSQKVKFTKTSIAKYAIENCNENDIHIQLMESCRIEPGNSNQILEIHEQRMSKVIGVDEDIDISSQSYTSESLNSDVAIHKDVSASICVDNVQTKVTMIEPDTKNIKIHDVLSQTLEISGMSAVNIIDNDYTTNYNMTVENVVSKVDTKGLQIHEHNGLSPISEVICMSQVDGNYVSADTHSNSKIVKTLPTVSEMKSRNDVTHKNNEIFKSSDLTNPPKVINDDNIETGSVFVFDEIIEKESMRLDADMKDFEDSNSSNTSEIIDVSQVSIYDISVDTQSEVHKNKETIDLISNTKQLDVSIQNVEGVLETTNTSQANTTDICAIDPNAERAQILLETETRDITTHINYSHSINEINAIDDANMSRSPSPVIEIAQLLAEENNTMWQSPELKITYMPPESQVDTSVDPRTMSPSEEIIVQKSNDIYIQVDASNNEPVLEIENVSCEQKDISRLSPPQHSLSLGESTNTSCESINTSYKSTNTSCESTNVSCESNNTSCESPLPTEGIVHVPDNIDDIEAKLAKIVGEPMIVGDTEQYRQIKDCRVEKLEVEYKDMTSELIDLKLYEKYVAEDIEQNVQESQDYNTLLEFTPAKCLSNPDHQYATLDGIFNQFDEKYELTYVSTQNCIIVSENEPTRQFEEEITEMSGVEMVDDISLDCYVNRIHSDSKNSSDLSITTVKIPQNIDVNCSEEVAIQALEHNENTGYFDVDVLENSNEEQISKINNEETQVDISYGSIINCSEDRIEDSSTEKVIVLVTLDEDCFTENFDEKTHITEDNMSELHFGNENLSKDFSGKCDTITPIVDSKYETSLKFKVNGEIINSDHEEVINDSEINVSEVQYEDPQHEVYNILAVKDALESNIVCNNKPKQEILNINRRFSDVNMYQFSKVKENMKETNISIVSALPSNTIDQNIPNSCADIEARLAEIVGEPLTETSKSIAEVSCKQLGTSDVNEELITRNLTLDQKYKTTYSVEVEEISEYKTMSLEEVTCHLSAGECQNQWETMDKKHLMTSKYTTRSVSKKYSEIISDENNEMNIDYFQVLLPKLTYSRQRWKTLKRKMDMSDVKTSEKKYRKGKNIDYPKITAASISETAYAKEYKRLFEYCSSIKFSYAIPFHKDHIDVHNTLTSWPIEKESDKTEDKIETDDTLFGDLENSESISDPLNQTLTQEIVSDYDESSYKPSNIDETNFNMGFGEGSGRVKQELKDGEYTTLSAATLSDVKQFQPLLPSDEPEKTTNRNNIPKNSNINEVLKIKEFINNLHLRDKVRSFFAKTKAELKWELINKKESLDSPSDISDWPFVLASPSFFRPSPILMTTNVVQVGQLPVSATAQNPVTCDPRVTHVSNVSPSQCSPENSSGDDIQTSIKTEYTELTTADITLPLMQEYAQHHQAVPTESQEATNLYGSEDNEPMATQIKSVVKIEFMEETSQENMNDDESYESNNQQQLSNGNGLVYQFDNIPNCETALSESNAQSVANSSDTQKTVESFPVEKRHNDTPDKSVQITDAINAACINTTQRLSNAQIPDASVNTLPQNTQSDVVTTSQANSNNYTKSTPINTIALQQALAQILPPPLNQTTSSDSNHQNSTHPPVLHIVQGNNAQSVINKPNGTQLLHIVQSKNTATTNGPPVSQSNNFGGLSLVDGAIQQNGNQLLHIVNTGNQKNNAGQLLKRVNLLTNLTNVQGSNEQKMVQFVCKSADGKSIQLPHQRSMVLRLQPIDPSNASTTPKQNEGQDNPSCINNLPLNDKEPTPQEMKSRSLYEENYAKFVQNGEPKLSLEKSTSLPKFNQVFGKQVYQENQNELGNDNLPENSECPPEDSAVSLEPMTETVSAPMIVRKAQTQPPGPPNIVQHIKQTIGPMNIQTMHGGVIYTRQIPVNIGNGQTINLITVPSTELVDDTGQKQQKVQEGDPPIIKIIPTSQPAATTNGSTDDKNPQTASTCEANSHPNPQPQPQPQPVLTQMRIKLPMLSKAPQMVGGTRVVRPSFFQIQRNVIGGANPQVYQQLVLTAAPPLGQSIRVTTQATKPKTQTETQSSQETQMSSSTLEQLREFDMVLEQVKERSTVQPGSSTSTNNFSKLNNSTDTTDCSTPNTSTQDSPTPVLYTVGNTQPLNVVNFVNRKSAITSTSTSSYVRSPDSTGIIESPSSSTHSNIQQTVTSESCASSSCASEAAATTINSKPKKKKSKPSTSHSNPFNIKNTPKPSSQKPLEDEQTTQRILYILAEYKEQVENSPDKDKPAPRRRNNPAAPNAGSSKRKKSSSGSRRRDMSPVNGEDSCRTMGSEDSSCGTSLGECNECLESHSPEESPRKVVRRLTFEQETHITQTRTIPQRNVIVADGQAFAVRTPTGKPATTVLMPANYLLPVSMVKGGQQIAIVTNRGPKLLVGAGEGGAGGTLLFQRLIGPGLKPVLTRPGVRHIRLPTAALHNLQAFNIATSASTGQPSDSTPPPTSVPNPPDLVDTRAMSSPWPDRDASEGKPEGGNSSPDGSEPWNLPSSSIADDYGYEEIVRTDNMDRTVLDAIPDRYSPDMEAQRIFDKMFDVDSKKSMYDSRCGYDIDASDDDKAYHQVVQRKDGRHTRLTHVSAAALRHKYAILEHELRLQKSLSEECEDLGVDSPSASELFPEAELLFAPSPAHEQTIDHCHTPQPTMYSQGIPQPDLDDQIATDHLLTHNDQHEELDINLDDVGEIVTVGEDGMTTIPLDHEEFARSHEEFARSHPNTTFHSEPEDSEIPPFTIAQGIKGRQITFHTRGIPGTVVMGPQTTVISQATVEPAGTQHTVKFTDIDNIINAMPTPQQPPNNIPPVLVKDGNEGLTKFDRLLNESRQLHLSNTASAIVHSTGNSTQVIRRVHYETRRDARYMADDSDALLSGEIKTDERRHIQSMSDTPSPERHPELFWDANTRPERRRFEFSSDSDKCCKSPYDEMNSDSSGFGAHTRLDSVIKAARTERRRSDGSSADDSHPPLRTYPPKRPHQHSHHHSELDRSYTGKTRAGDRCHDGKDESRRRASNRGVVKRGCHCCNGSTAPTKPKKSRPKKSSEFPN